MSAISNIHLYFHKPLPSRFAALLTAACVFLLAVAPHLSAQETNESAPQATEVAQTTPAPLKPPIQPQFVDYIASDIASLMQDDEYQIIDVTLNAGEERERAHQFPVFIVESQKALSMGTFYLISDVPNNGAQIHPLMQLANEMSRYGWHSVIVPAPPLLLVMTAVTANQEVLSTKLNNVPDASIQMLADTDEQSSGADSPTLADPQTQVAAKFYQNDFDATYQMVFNSYLSTFLSATIDATSQQGYQLIFAQGMSAQSLIDLSGKNITPDALVISNAYWPQRDINYMLPIRIAKSGLPMLDLVSAGDNQWALSTQQARKNKADVEVKTHYRQRKISGTNQTISADIGKEIYGWLTYLGW